MTIEARLVNLRRPRTGDLPLAARLFAEPRCWVSLWRAVPPPRRTFPRRYAITVAGRACGFVWLCPAGRAGATGLAVWVSRPDRGRGIGTAAVAQACRPGFDGQHLQQIQATALITQGDWQRVLEKNGFTAPSPQTPGDGQLTFTIRPHLR
ncbi:MAG TPA: GNAT family N-acetyltransferase [Micromonosporaceae bacterium]|nr:GNAT family N-acetyltransferase [Micromonosporaceae bacterium]